MKTPPSNEEDVVTATTTVRFRPDLHLSVQAPTQGRVNVPINITATVSERLKDSGADVNVVATEGDTALDRTSHPIWVAPNGSADVAMTLVFREPGTHRVTVKLEGQFPTDYDPNGVHSRKSVDFDIEVVAANHPLLYSLGYYDYQWGYEYAGYGNYTSVDAFAGHWEWDGYYQTYSYTGDTHGAWNYVTGSQGRAQGNWFWGWTDRYVAFPIDRISVATITNGKTIEERTLENVDKMWSWTASGDDWSYENGGAWFYFPDTSSWLYLYSFRSRWGGYSYEGTSLGHGRYAGNVTYWSKNWAHFWGNYTYAYDSTWGSGTFGGAYDYQCAWEYAYTFNYGSPVEYGDSLEEIATFTKDGETFGGRASTSSTYPLESSWSYDYCWDYDWSWSYEFSSPPNWSRGTSSGSGDGCYESKGFTRGIFGYGWGETT